MAKIGKCKVDRMMERQNKKEKRVWKQIKRLNLGDSGLLIRMRLFAGLMVTRSIHIKNDEDKHHWSEIESHLSYLYYVNSSSEKTMLNDVEAIYRETEEQLKKG